MYFHFSALTKFLHVYFCIQLQVILDSWSDLFCTLLGPRFGRIEQVFKHTEEKSGKAILYNGIQG